MLLYARTCNDNGGKSITIENKNKTISVQQETKNWTHICETCVKKVDESPELRIELRPIYQSLLLGPLWEVGFFFRCF